MKSKLTHIIITAVALLFFPNVNFAQAPTLGTAVNYVLFSSVGQVSMTGGISQVTGNIGSNNVATSPGFGNVNGVMDNIDAASALCKTDLQTAYNQLVADVPTFVHGILLGNGEILVAGTYSIAAATTMNGDLYLNGSSSDVFVFKISGTFAANASSRVILTGGVLACNVFWLVQGGAISMAASTSMKGTIITNEAISMSAGDTLEGRALTTVGAITVDGVLAYTPTGCGSIVLTGPAAPNLASTACYTLFSSDGPVTDNGGASHIIGDVGTNLGSATGFNPLFVTGSINNPDPSTIACASDLTNVYNYLNGLSYDIQLLYPVQLGNGLVLTPHTYWLNGAATLTDTLYLNAEGDASAVFVLQIEGAFTESGTGAKVKLINGALAQNVFWLVNGAVTLNSLSVFSGTIVSNEAITLNTGDTLYGRALTIVGAVNSTAIVAKMPPGCSTGGPIILTQPINQIICSGDSVSFFVTATGASLIYQWRKGTVNVINGGNISGATSDTLTFNPVTVSDTSSFYNVIVSSSAGPNDTSIDVKLTVNPSPVVVTGPLVTMCYGDTISIGGPAVVGDTYKWTPNEGLSAYNISNPMASPADTITYTLTVINTVTGCKSADSVKINVKPVPTAVITAGDTVDFCHGGSITLTATNGASYLWSTGATTQSIIVADSGKFSVGVTYADGCTSHTGPTLVLINPLPIANAGLFRSICIGDSTVLGTITVAGLSYSWSPVTGLNSSTKAQPKASPLISMTYTLTVTDTTEGCKNTDTVTVNVLPQPTANAGTYKLICKGDSTAIGAPAILGITYTWLPVTGLNSSTSSQPNASPASTTTYTLTASNGTCSNKDTVTVKVNPLPSANAGPNISICLGDGDTIGTTAIAGESYNWQPATGLSNASIAQPNASPAITTTYTLTVSGVASLCKNTDTVIVTVVPQPIANTGIDKNICKGDSVSIGVLTVPGVNYNWLPATGLSSNTLSEPNASPAVTTTYTLTVSNGVCSNSGTVSVTVNTPPVANAGPDKNICMGANTTIGTAAIPGDNYTWSPATGLNSNTVSQPNASPSATSTYVVTVTNGSCSNTDSVIVTVYPLPVVVMEPNQYLCDAGSVELGSPAIAGDTYLWSPSISLNSSTISQPTATPGTTTIYTVVETDTTTGCINSGQVTVTVNSAEFYTGISPNGDGINDWWNIPMLDCYPTNTVSIINRWGSEVWSGSNYDNNTIKWTGENMSGTPLPDGTYYYIIRYNNTEKRGWVFIKR